MSQNQFENYDRQPLHEQFPTSQPQQGAGGTVAHHPSSSGDAQQPQVDENFGPLGKFFSLKVHGTKAALEIKYDRTRAGFHTIRIEAASVVKDSTSRNKTYQWDAKIALQITKTDLINFLKVTLLIEAEGKFAHYGAGNDKSAEFKYQNDKYGKKLFAQISQKGKPLLGIPIPFEDLALIGHMALNQYLKNYPNLSADSVIHTLERQAAL